MAQVQSRPEQDPDFRPEETPYALLALHRGEAMGFTDGEDIDFLRRIDTLLAVLQDKKIASAIIAQLRPALEEKQLNAEHLNTWFKHIYEALADNPAPPQEIVKLREYFGDDILAELLQISPTSVQRYARTEREAPDHVVDRAHWLALVVGYLTGTYNEYGVRRWFERPRTALDGNNPKQTLLSDENWSSQSAGAQKVEQLAKALIGMPAT